MTTTPDDVFYILKIRLRRVPVSTLLFWQQIFEEKKRRALWQRPCMFPQGAFPKSLASGAI